MSNIWATRNKVFNKPNRNVFDHSFQNNLTMKQGYLTPVFCKEVLPGDSIRIGKDTMAAFNMLPMTFPVQTRMKLNTHFFYVRNRTLWKDFPDFFTNSKKDLISPYIDFAKLHNRNMLRQGSLLDYLNVPVTVPAGSFSTQIPAVLNSSSNPSLPTHAPIFNFVGQGKSATCVYGSEAGLALELQSFSYSINGNSNILKQFTRYVPLTDDIDSVSAAIRDNKYSSIPIIPRYAIINPTAESVKAAYVNKPEDFVNFARLNVGYNVPLSDLKVDSSLVFELRFPNLVPVGTPSSNLNVKSNLGHRLAHALHKLSFVYLTVSDQGGSRRVVSFIDFSSLGLKYDDNTDEYVLSVSYRLSSDDYSYIHQSTIGANAALALDFAVYPILGDLSYKVGAGSLTKITYTSSQPDYGWLSTFAAPAPTTLGRLPYSIITNALHTAAAAAADCAITSFCRARLDNVTVDLYDEYDSSPYYDSVDNPHGLKISSLPLRAYEFIYNAFYRDSRNNPFMVNGLPEYNKYLTSDDGGNDTNVFQFYRRNWEADHLTTACTTPQLGDAPLVGITSSGVAQFKDVDGVTHEVQLITSPDDDDTITSWKTSDVPNSVQRTLVNLATSGVSISDFRNVNALQRWLELNLRAGIRYKDVIKERWGMTTRYDDALLPEFLGGFSTSIDVNMISNTNGDGQAALGDYAGQGSCFGKLNHNISCVCDEPGFIIGIASITPTPVYSQLLPKHFLKSNVLDYFQPEFGNISLQPITYAHVCPVEAKRAGLDFGTVFGYQRAWWEYLSATDEVHGQFRGNLRNFLVNRVFSVPPALNPDFLVVDPETVNDIFVVDESVTDPFLGQFRFDVSIKRPIPRYGIPQIEDASTTAH